MALTTFTSYSSSSFSSSSSPPSSSSFSTPKSLKYDVFLSFRGEDTRNNFTSHLNHALHQRGILTFMDNQLIRGEEISPSLITAIQESKISIVIFSKNYASSAWCLDELLMILDCQESLGQLVWPIFLYVEPSHVRNQTGSFGDALVIYEAPHDSTNDDKYKEKLPKWKIGLRKAGNLSGWHLKEGDESELIQRIVEATLSKLNRTPLYVAKHPVGIDAYVRSLGSLANVGANDVRAIGIHGTGGIGKTTVAKAVFSKFADEFEGSSFLANVRETSQQYCGLVQLQQTLLFEMLGDHLQVGNTHRGINIIRDRLRHKRVLLVLDDVDQLDQLEALAGEHAWFGPGSRVIITTRNKHFLTTFGVDATYEVKGLNYDEALELLSWNAFNENKPAEGYSKLSQRVVEYADGNPLALVVVGSFLCRRNKRQWKSAIEDIERKLHKQVYGILKISFDALQDNQKKIFLDIACFFVGEDREYVIKALECFDLSPTIGIEVLIEMSLISIEWDSKVRMHNLIQEMGWEIVRQESAEVGKRSRLWLTEDVNHVLLENTGTNAIEGIKLVFPKQDTLYLSSEAFKKMKRLRLLIFRNVILSTPIQYLPAELRFIDWPGYQFPTLPLNPGPKQLVRLNMPNSHIQQLGEGFRNFKNLKVVNLSSSKFLTEIPDLSTVPKLKRLYLGECTNLVEIHDSVGSLKRLHILDLKFCSNLKTLPRSFHSKYHRKLNLQSCFSVEKFPNINVEIKFLDELCLSGSAIKELPCSIDNIVRLKFLDLACCEKLEHIPNSIYNLHHLERIYLFGCSKLSKFPSQELLRPVDSDSGSLKLPFQKLKWLDLENCNLSEADFLMRPNGFDNLEILSLGGNQFVSFPSLNRFSKLRKLDLFDCESLGKIPELPGNLMILDASDCKSLIETNMGNLMDGIIWNKDNEIQVICPGRQIPHWFTNKCEGKSADFILESAELEKIAGVIVCVVFKSDWHNVNFRLHCDTNDVRPRELQTGQRSRILLTRSIVSVKQGYMCLHYLPVRFISESWTDNKYGVSFSDVFGKKYRYGNFRHGNFISMCGVHIVWDEDDNKTPCPPPPPSLSSYFDGLSRKRKWSDYYRDNYLVFSFCGNKKPNFQTLKYSTHLYYSI